MIDVSSLKVLPGRPFPIGPAVRPRGVRFAVISRHAKRVWLALFNDKNDNDPVVEFEYDPVKHNIGDVWSLFVDGLKPGALYAFRMDGPFEPENGHWYDAKRYLIDPYARALVWGGTPSFPKCLVVDEDLDWSEDIHPRVPMHKTVIYETHVRGLTMHESSGVKNGGTYKALIEKIPYLKNLGVTTVELMPVQAMGEFYTPRTNPETGEALKDYWGYSPIGFFAPTGRYASTIENGESIEEFRAMVAALHAEGIEVILDVVFNHTAEGSSPESTLCFRGIDNSIYYLLGKNGEYLNFSGCGNTMNCNHPLVRDFILDSLRYWVVVLHVDGFRFDLASILGRDREGNVVENPPLVERIAEDPILRDIKLIAEAWDAGGAYQVGNFGDHRWADWNGRFRDEVRQFWLGSGNMKGAFASRLTGSADLYQWTGRDPTHSINFITAHDGFTLRDLVSYNEKHNLANGEDNRDGSDANYSWNCGVEGETDDPVIEELRLRLQKNLVASLFLSLGVPMFMGGDEFGRTQKGNNNAYCQDNEISWYDWSFLEKNQDLHNFCRQMIQFRKENPVFSRDRYFTGRPTVRGQKADILWFDARGKPQAWSAGDLSLACWINGTENDSVALYLIFNPSMEDRKFQVPEGNWTVRVDTSQDSRDEEYTIEAGGTVFLQPKSLMVLSARRSM